jgi:hypothetical protein
MQGALVSLTLKKRKLVLCYVAVVAERFLLHEGAIVVGSYLPDFFVGDHYCEVWGYPGDIH